MRCLSEAREAFKKVLQQKKSCKVNICSHSIDLNYEKSHDLCTKHIGRPAVNSAERRHLTADWSMIGQTSKSAQRSARFLWKNLLASKTAPCTFARLRLNSRPPHPRPVDGLLMTVGLSP